MDTEIPGEGHLTTGTDTRGDSVTSWKELGITFVSGFCIGHADIRHFDTSCFRTMIEY